jgi:hypothetical protein
MRETRQGLFLEYRWVVVFFLFTSPILRETWQVMKWASVRVNGSHREVILSLLTILVLDCGVKVDCRDHPVGSSENKNEK